MTVDTSRPAVEALIAEHEMLWARGAYINVSLANQIEQTLAALLDERDAQNGALSTLEHTVQECQQDIEKREQRIRFLESEFARESDLRRKLQTDAENGRKRIRDLEVTNRKISERSANHHDNAIKWRERAERAEVGYETMLESLHRVEAEHNKLTAELADETKRADENYDDVHKWRSKARKLAAKLDAVKAWATAEDKATEMSWSDYNCGRGDAAREVLAILADTDEPKAGWVCSKCAREAVRGYDDGQIPEHHRTCSKRMPDTDEPRDSITFNTDDLGPATDIDGNPLADTDEGSEQ